jgi:hypothetical protein
MAKLSEVKTFLPLSAPFDLQRDAIESGSLLPRTVATLNHILAT